MDICISEDNPDLLARKIYDKIYKLELKKESEAHKKGNAYVFDPFNSGIDHFVKDKTLAEELRNTLKTQRIEKQKEVKQKAISRGAFVYHISNVSPEKIEDGVLRPRKQPEHFRDQGNLNAVFASSDENWAMSLKLGNGISTLVRKTSQSPKRTVIVSDKDKFFAFKSQHPYSYQYKFPAELFEPNVGYNGEFSGEWYALDKCVKIDPKNCTRKSVDDVIATDADLYFIAKGQSFHAVCAALNSKEKDVEQLVKSGALLPYKPGDLGKVNRLFQTLTDLHKNTR